MKCTKVQDTIQRSLALIHIQFPLIRPIATALQEIGGRVFLVGGAVRDIFVEKEIKDLDIEVHGVSLQQLEAVLKSFGNVRLVGKSFGVLRVDGLDVDWSIPRSDSAGRFPKVTLDQSMPIKEACRRRDLTMNAMMIDLETGQLEDPFNGLQAIRDNVLRTPDSQFFVQDPLRFYRVMQFIGRFEMMPDEQLTQVCSTMDISEISKERIFDEFEKLLIKGKKPSLAFEWLLHMGRLKELLPELYATKGCEQDLGFHPEGDVFEHSMQAVDGAAQQSYDTSEQRLIMVLAALCHDLGKSVASCIIDGRIRSHGHALAGVSLADALLDRMGIKQSLKKPITRLVRYHMDPVAFVKNDAKAAAYKRLARNLAPEVSLRMLTQLAIIDKSARNPQLGKPLTFCPEPLLETFAQNAQRYGVFDVAEKPLLSGKDFVGDIPEGPALGALLRRAYDLQIEEGISDKDELKNRVLMDR